MGLVGIPAEILIESIRYGFGTQTYEERRVILHKIYSHLRAYLPISYDKDNKREEYNQKLAPLLEIVAKNINIAREQYKSSFEGGSCDPDEKEFQGTLDTIYEQLDEIKAISKVVDREKPENMEMIF
jgi:hypothetical protein